MADKDHNMAEAVVEVTPAYPIIEVDVDNVPGGTRRYRVVGLPDADYTSRDGAEARVARELASKYTGPTRRARINDGDPDVYDFFRLPSGRWKLNFGDWEYDEDELVFEN